MRISKNWVTLFAAMLAIGGCEFDGPRDDGLPWDRDVTPISFGDSTMSLDNFALTPDNVVDVTGGPDSTTCEVTVTDIPNNVMSAGCVVWAPTAGPKSCISRSPTGDVWSCPLQYDAEAENGTHNVSYAFAVNDFGEHAIATQVDLQAGPYDNTVTVTNPSADTTGPSIAAFALPRVSIDLEIHPNEIECKTTATDPSGVGSASCTWQRDGTDELYSRITRTQTANVWTAKIPISQTGTYTLVSVTATDVLGNKTVLNRTNVPGPTAVTVTALQGPAEVWMAGPADTCTPNAAIGAACICEGVEYTSGFCCDGTGEQAPGFSWSNCAQAALYVVPPGGTGNLSGSDWGNALSSLPGSLARDTVYWLASGTYETAARTFSDALSGSDGITLRKATAAEHGTETGWLAGYGEGQAFFDRMLFSTGRYTVDGGELRGIRSAITYLWDGDQIDIDADDVVIRNMDIDGSTGPANPQVTGVCSNVKVQNARAVIDRVAAYNAADDGIEITGGGDDLIIANNKIYSFQACGTDNGCGPCNNGHSDGIEINGPTVVNTRVVGNLIYDLPPGSTACLFTQNGVNNLFAANNICYAPDVGGPLTLKGADGATLRNNIFWGRTQGTRYGGCYLDGSQLTNLTFRNNICTNILTSHEVTSDYNALEHDIDFNQWGVLETNEYAGGVNDQIGNPFFAAIALSTDPADHQEAAGLELADFLPTTNSPTIDQGEAVGDAWSIEGTTRPVGAAWDMGAFEHNGVPGTGGTGGTGGAGATGGTGATGGGGVGGSGGGFDPACAAKTPDSTTSGDVWAATAQAAASADLTVTAYVRPASDNAIFAVSSIPVTAFSEAAMLVRFNAGIVDAYDNNTYREENTLVYTTDEWHKVTINTNVAAGTYTVDVGVCDQVQTRIVTDAAFRSTAPTAGGMDNTNIWSFTGSLDVQGIVWSPGVCTPNDCVDVGAVCGSPPDGCGGVVASAPCAPGCTGPDVCYPEGTCCTPATCVTLGNYVCGIWDDGCNGNVDCGTCTNPETCQNDGTCAVSSKPWASNTGTLPSFDGTGTAPNNITNGSTFENFTDGGRITIDADNVTLRNFQHAGGGNTYAIHIKSGATNTLIEDGDITGGTSTSIFDEGQGTIMRRLHIHECESDAIKLHGDNGTVEDSYWHRLGLRSGAHADGIQSQVTAHGYTVRGNNCWMPSPGTPNHEGGSPNSCIIWGDGTYNNWTVDGNWFNGGTNTLNCPSSPGGITISNNLFGKDNVGWPSNPQGNISKDCGSSNWVNNQWEDGDPPGSIPP